MIDLSKAKAGDIAKFRCGGQATICEIKAKVCGWFEISFNEVSASEEYRKDGLGYAGQTSSYDIIEIVQAPEVFDFTKAKWGMAFLSKRTGETLYFIGKRIGGGVWFSGGSSTNSIQAFLENYIVENFSRTPEHDAESGVEE